MIAIDFMNKLKIIAFLLVNLFFLSHSHAQDLKFCENIISEMLNYKSFPQKAKVFTQLKPICVKNDNGNAVFKMLMYANKNNEPSDSNREKMIEMLIKNGPNMMCRQEDMKPLLQIIDVRVGLRIEENTKEIGYFDISEKICQNISK
jgi:hypothetical protein